MEIYTPKMLAERFNVTTLNPYNIEFKEPVKVQGRKMYNDAEAVSLSVTENLKFGFSAVVYVVVSGHYRKINWNKLSDREKIEIQFNLNL